MPRAHRFRISNPGLAFTIAVLAVPAIWSCSSAPTEVDTEPVTFSTVFQASHTGLEQPGQEVVRDDGHWTRVWQQIHSTVTPIPAKPSIDFASRMLVVAAMGERPTGCYKTDVDSIRAGAGRLAVSVLESEPGATCVCTQAVTHPVHVVELQRVEATPHFDVRKRSLACE